MYFKGITLHSQLKVKFEKTTSYTITCTASLALENLSKLSYP